MSLTLPSKLSLYKPDKTYGIGLILKKCSEPTLTFYFDSEVEQEKALRQKGFGKDGKLGKTQVLFPMMIDKNEVEVV